jgi:hypothetical protein
MRYRATGPLEFERRAAMSDGREEREEQEKRRELEEKEFREDWIDHKPVDEWAPERDES